jgi:hypothetical protein
MKCYNYKLTAASASPPLIYHVEKGRGCGAVREYITKSWPCSPIIRSLSTELNLADIRFQTGLKFVLHDKAPAEATLNKITAPLVIYSYVNPSYNSITCLT